MNKSTKAFLSWTVVCVIGAALMLWKLPNIKWGHPGKDVTFSVSDGNQFITAKPAIIEVASSNFFLLRNKKTSEVVSGLPKPKPLGWSSDEYYTAGPVDFGAGTWIVEKGAEITVHLTAKVDINTIELKDDESRMWATIVLLVLAFILWLLGCAFGSDIKWDE